MPPRTTRRRRPHLTPWTAAGAVTAIAATVGLAFGVSDDSPTAGRAGNAAPIVETGEQNSMGMPVIETPGAATGTASAGTVETDAANWALGTVPLNTAVRPTWVLRNTGTAPVTVGQPHPEVRQGCCPGPFIIGTDTIPPGGQTTLSFELSMHPGMDGWHDIAVLVPVSDGSAQDSLTLGVTGDFRGL